LKPDHYGTKFEFSRDLLRAAAEAGVTLLLTTYRWKEWWEWYQENRKPVRTRKGAGGKPGRSARS
jgi:hypothetical protein